MPEYQNNYLGMPQVQLSSNIFIFLKFIQIKTLSTDKRIQRRSYGKNKLL